MDRELLAWVDRRRGERSRGDFVREVLRERMDHESEEAVRRMLDRAAKERTDEDRAEREALISGVADRS